MFHFFALHFPLSMPTAPAKLNLLLSVGAPEPAGTPRAGWHRVLSWVCCIDLADEVTIDRLPDGQSSRYEITWAEDAPRVEAVDWPIEKDLAVRAHKALEARAGCPLPVALRVRKRIPTGAGLGGGSSDAAAVLRSVSELFGLEVPFDDLCATAATLGSDVPYFLDDESPDAPRPAIVSGFGEGVERTDAVAGEVVLVIPPFKCATQGVYRAFDDLLADEQRADEHQRMLRDLKGPARQWGPREQLVRGRVERMLQAGELDASLLSNDLAKAAFQVEPRLGALSTALSKVTRLDAHVTGSGSCVFLFAPKGKEEWVVERAGRVANGCVVMRVSLA
jgi:4-diphosphocytidyl-2-C-methyl-D-erythritol kinase